MKAWLFLIILVFSLQSLAITEKERVNVKADKKILNSVPKDAAALITSLPQQRINMDLILKRAIGVSDQFKIITADQIEKDAVYFESLQLLDWTFDASLGVHDDRSEPLNALSTTRIQTEQYKVGISKYFSTGTSLSFEFQNTDGDVQFGVFPASEYNESRGQITLAQDLLQDFLGRSTDLLLDAGELQKKALEAQFLEGATEFVIQLNQLYYQAWVSQARLVATQKNLEANQRLLRISRKKLNRGTTERPDFLQIKSSAINAENEVSQARQDLANIWRALATSLKFPETWLDIDPAKIPLALDEPVQDSKRLCGSESQLNPAPLTRAGLVKLKRQALASEKILQRASNYHNPQLQFQFIGTSNGVDPDRAESFEEFTKVRTPGLTVGLSMKWNIESFKERADLQRAKANNMRAQTLYEQSSSNQNIDWINACKNLFRIERNIKSLKQAMLHQQQRAKLEERRFGVGRIPAFNVIQAQNDLVFAELTYRNGLAEVRKVAWEIKALAGNLENYVMQTLKEQAGE